MNKITKNIAALIAFGIGTTTISFAQVTQQKIGNNPTLINPNAALEVESTTKGLLLPRLGLSATNNFAPLLAHVAGMTVYNTATAGTAPNNVTPGYYYNDGTQWVRIATGADAKTEPWRQQTTTNEATANSQSIYQTGSVAVGDFSTAASTKKMEVKGDFKAEAAVTGGVAGIEIANPQNPNGAMHYWSNGTNYRIASANNLSSALTAITGATTNTFAATSTNSEMSSVNGGNSLSTVRAENTGNFFMESYNVTANFGSTFSLQNDGVRIRHTNTNGSGNPFPLNNDSEIFLQKATGVRFSFRDSGGNNPQAYWFPITTGNAGQVLTQSGTGGKIEWRNPAVEPWNVMGSPAGTQATSNTQNIFQTGNVSIGGSNNTGKLNVINTAGSGNSLDFTMVANRAPGDATNPATLNFYSNLGTGSFTTLATAGDKALIFSTDGDANTDSTNGFLIAPHVNGGKPYGFKITEQGKATINATTPTETFDINGTTRVRDLPTSGTANAIYNGAETKATTFTATRTVVADANGVLGTVAGLPLAATEPWNVIGSPAGTQATTNAQNIYQMGNVAIGATTAPSFIVGSGPTAQTIQPKLHVAGDISTTGKVWTTNSVYADYVFEKYFKGNSDINPNYEFKSLNYVKEFIKANNHLPGVESIADLAKAENGYTFDITKLTVQSLEKIEELYLHTIEQQDKIEAQQAEIDALKKDAEETKVRLEKLEILLTGNK